MTPCLTEWRHGLVIFHLSNTKVEMSCRCSEALSRQVLSAFLRISRGRVQKTQATRKTGHVINKRGGPSCSSVSLFQPSQFFSWQPLSWLPRSTWPASTRSRSIASLAAGRRRYRRRMQSTTTRARRPSKTGTDRARSASHRGTETPPTV